MEVPELKRLVNFLDRENHELFGSRPNCPIPPGPSVTYGRNMQDYMGFHHKYTSKPQVYETVANFLECKIE